VCARVSCRKDPRVHTDTETRSLGAVSMIYCLVEKTPESTRTLKPSHEQLVVETGFRRKDPRVHTDTETNPIAYHFRFISCRKDPRVHTDTETYHSLGTMRIKPSSRKDPRVHTDTETQTTTPHPDIHPAGRKDPRVHTDTETGS